MVMHTMNPLGPGQDGRAERTSTIMKDGQEMIVLDRLPADVREHLKVFDANGSGLVGVSILARVGRAYRERARDRGLLRKALLLAAALGLVFLLLGAGLSFAVSELAKETEISEDATMRSTVNRQVVQTQNSDMTTDQEGILRDRHSRSHKPISTSTVAVQHTAAAASALSSRQLGDLTKLQFAEGHRYFKVNIIAARRIFYAEANGTDDVANSHISFDTPYGEISFHNDRTITFSSDGFLARLRESGFKFEDDSPSTAAGPGRRLRFATAESPQGAAFAVAVVGGVSHALICPNYCDCSKCCYVQSHTGFGYCLHPEQPGLFLRPDASVNPYTGRMGPASFYTGDG